MIDIDYSRLDARWFFEMLERSPSDFVSVIDHHGVIRMFNETAAGAFGGAPADYEGATLYDIFSREAAAERKWVLRRCLRSNSPFLLIETVRGVHCHTTLRRISGSTRRSGLALVVCRPAPRRSLRSSETVGHVVRHMKRNDLDPLKRLTPHQAEVLRELATGLSIQDVAQRIHRTVKTVEAHRTAISKRLGVSSRAELMLVALRAGLLPYGMWPSRWAAPKDQTGSGTDSFTTCV